jgi:hypothetical protein
MKTQNSDNFDRIVQIIKYLNLKKIIHQHPKFFILSLGLSLFAFLIFITFKLTDIGNKIDNLNANKLSDEKKIQTQFRANNKKKQILSYGKYKEYLFLSYLSLSSIKEGEDFKYNATLWEMAGFENGEFKVDLQERITQQYQTILGYSVDLSAFIHNVAKEGKKCRFLRIDNLLQKDKRHINESFKTASIKSFNNYCGNFKHKINSIIACAVPNEKQTKAVGLIILSFAEPIPNAIKTTEELQKFCNAPALIKHDHCLNSSSCNANLDTEKTYIDLFLEDMEIFTKELIQASY